MQQGEARERLGAARVGRLATVRPDGSPHVVPFVFALDGDTIYWAVDRKPKRSSRLQRLQNIAAEPRVEVVVDGYDEDWRIIWWVRAFGTARTLPPGREAERAVRLLGDKYPQYAADAPGGPVVAIRVERWSGWKASS